jgi:putative transposase
MSLPSHCKPCKGVHFYDNRLTVVFLTICTYKRKPWLACDAVHQRLRLVWTQQNAWQVTDYVLLPDHLHLFAHPGGAELLFDPWVKAWKSLFSRTKESLAWQWQSGCFHHRIRNWENADAKTRYIRENPIRLGLVKNANDWRFQGQLFDHQVVW